jgi:2-dehydro-3-deoxy-D-arabinonate dehydratase
MKIYKTQKGIIVEKTDQFFEVKDKDWDKFINDDNLFNKLLHIAATASPAAWQAAHELIAPIWQQEVWACGVTYLRSKIGRQEESQDAGGGDFYAKVYEAERP